MHDILLYKGNNYRTTKTTKIKMLSALGKALSEVAKRSTRSGSSSSSRNTSIPSKKSLDEKLQKWEQQEKGDTEKNEYKKLTEKLLEMEKKPNGGTIEEKAELGRNFHAFFDRYGKNDHVETTTEDEDEDEDEIKKDGGEEDRSWVSWVEEKEDGTEVKGPVRGFRGGQK